ncbi:MAG: hypothetical protein EBY14_13380, partial [Betaproteobacteria bacterium]|nr:hypothetical protein [Betaproteobacteria bacterium]
HKRCCCVSRHPLITASRSACGVVFHDIEPADPVTFVVLLPRIQINTGAAQDPKKIALSFTTIEIIDLFQP